MSQSESLIYYHESQRGSRVIPLRSYANTPPEEKFAGLDTIEFKVENVSFSIQI